ncbi:Proteoglycan Cow, partial [Armadillidium nasatum]
FSDRIVPAKDSPSSRSKIGKGGHAGRSESRDYGDDADYEDEEDNDEDDDYLLEDDDDDDSVENEMPEEDDEDTSKFSPDKINSEVPKLNRRPFARKQCTPCPVVRPLFLCGTDNKTYSTLCRLHYHNCLHDENVQIACKGFCPCKDPNSHSAKKERQRKRLNAYMNKLHGTVNDEVSTTSPSQSERKGKSRETNRDGERRSGRSQNRYSRSKIHKKYFKKNGEKSRSNHPKLNSRFAKQNSDKYWKRNWPDYHKNEVTFKNSNSVWGTNECSQDALEAMGNRMLDWFSVIMADSRRRPANPQPGPTWCKREVSWMLGHLDQDNDQKLSVKELYRLEHDDRERCIKPFIDRCDLDRDLFLSTREWCKCFDKSDRPCAALRKASKDLLGGYIPECDSEGYYRPTQCHVSASMCWCVDKHGVEITGSRTRGTPNCDSLVKNRRLSTNHIDDDAEGDADDAETYEGSADMPLDI